MESRPLQEVMSEMTTQKAYEGIKQMGWYIKAQRAADTKRLCPQHWWAIVMQHDQPNQLECAKCGKVCQSQEEYDTGECERFQLRLKNKMSYRL